ncbi:MAG: hypothetical protein WCL08_11230 [Verrucomicrobiota bacterium]
MKTQTALLFLASTLSLAAEDIATKVQAVTEQGRWLDAAAIRS